MYIAFTIVISLDGIPYSHYSLQNTSVNSINWFLEIHRINTCSTGSLLLLNPACSCQSLMSTVFLILVIITLPNTFAASGSNVIPLQFLHSMRLPFLEQVYSELLNQQNVPSIFSLPLLLLFVGCLLYSLLSLFFCLFVAKLSCSIKHCLHVACSGCFLGVTSNLVNSSSVSPQLLCRKWPNGELTLKCKLKCYVKPMKDQLGVSPSKGTQGTTRGKEKILLISVRIKPTTSGLDLPSLCRLSYEVRQRKLGTIKVVNCGEVK